MADTVEVKAVYGAFRVVKHSGTKFICRCTNCKDKQTLTSAKLLKNPECTVCASAPPEVMLDNYLSKIRTTLGDDKEIDEEALNSLFGKDAERIMSLISSTEEKDRGFSMFQVRMLITLVDLVPIAEQRVREQSGAQSAIYGLNALINSIRELINDMQANQEQSNLAANIVEKVMYPIFTSFAHMYVSQANQLKTALHPHVKDNRFEKVENAVVEGFREMGRRTEEMYGKIHVDLKAFLE